ncbi:hypothetical protein HOE04_01115 [archaeon]|jgi:hypothetical protein|nr:hypothetical protein [archaeon]
MGKKFKILISILFLTLLTLGLFFSSNLTGFVINEEPTEQKFKSKIDSLEIKEPTKLLGTTISKNKNKRMEFDMQGNKIRLYFELLNYSEFIEKIAKDKITPEIDKEINIKEKVEEESEIIEEETNLEEEKESEIIEEVIEETIEETPKEENETIEEVIEETNLEDEEESETDEETIEETNLENDNEETLKEESETIKETPEEESQPQEILEPTITGNMIKLIFKNLITIIKNIQPTGKVITEEVIEVDLEEVQQVVNDLTKQEIKVIEEEIEINLDNEEFNINVTTTPNETEDNYKWGYEVKLKDLQFLAKIEVTANESISIYDKHTLKIGRNILSFSDLIKEGYTITIEKPALEINVDINTPVIETIEEETNLEEETDVETIEEETNLEEETDTEIIEKENIGAKKNRANKKTNNTILTSTTNIETPQQEPETSNNILQSITGLVIDEEKIKDKTYENSITIYIEQDFREQNLYKVGDMIYLDPTLMIIPITNAEHLDENKNYISNIYNETKTRDNIWSEPIENNHYVRATFEKALDNTKDITIYAKSNNHSEVIVYIQDNEEIARFTNIQNENKYKIYLTNLSEEISTFDLKVLGNNVEFDWIVDPPCPTTMAGSGTLADPCIITNCTELQDMNNELTNNYSLANNINCSDTINWNSGAGFLPVGNETNNYKFTGNFLGNNYNITNLTIYRPSTNYIGLFGRTEYSNIYDIGLENVNITGKNYVGSLAGFPYYTIINNSFVTGNVTGEAVVGGLTGYFSHGNISNSYAIGNFSGDRAVGGLAGNAYLGRINNSYMIGNVSINADENRIGGLIGSPWGVKVENSYYNYNSSLLNGASLFTVGALYEEQFNQWLANNKTLVSIDDYLTKEGDYYIINNYSDLKQLRTFGQNPNLKFKLNSDINLEDNFYIPYLTGEFDGNGKQITGLNLNYSVISGLALFGNTIYFNISNISILDVNISGSSEEVGGLIGTFYYSNIDNAYSTGDVNGNQYIGGLIGSISYSSFVDNSYATGNVNGIYDVGGLIGYSYSSTIDNSYATGNVTGSGYDVGGLLGYLYTSTINNSYATGDVIGSSYAVGGLVGYQYYISIIDNSYATGDVNGTEKVGGLVGYTSGLTLDNSYATGDVNGTEKVGGLVGYLYYYSTIDNSYATGDVNGTDKVGGLVGYLYYSSTIDNAYATGNVNGSSYVGGLVGYGDGTSTVDNSYWNNHTGNPDVCDETGLFSSTNCTAIQDNESYFYNVSNPPMNVWNFLSFWDNVYNLISFPVLRFQRTDSVAPVLTFSCSPTSVTVGETITCSCSAVDNFDTEVSLSYTANPSTLNDGTFTTTCTGEDNYNNIASANINYEVIISGGGIIDSSIEEVLEVVEVLDELGLEEVYEIELEQGQAIETIIGEEVHSVGVLEIYETSALIEIRSEVQKELFNIGDKKKFDLTRDGYNDLHIHLVSIENKKANIIIQSINEKIENIEEEEPIKKEKNLFIYFIITIIILISIVLLFVIIKKKKKGKKKKSNKKRK